MQERRRRSGAAVEGEGDRAARGVGAGGDIGGVEDRGRALAVLVEQRQRSGGGGVIDPATGGVDRVAGDRILRQEPQDARARLAG